jgi:hypothetical protein
LPESIQSAQVHDESGNGLYNRRGQRAASGEWRESGHGERVLLVADVAERLIQKLALGSTVGKRRGRGALRGYGRDREQ